MLTNQRIIKKNEKLFLKWAAAGIVLNADKVAFEFFFFFLLKRRVNNR